MKTYLVQGHADLVGAVESHLRCRDNDYSGSLVVFPGKRPAHFLRRKISVRLGSAFLPPRICSMDEFIDLICSRRGLSAARSIEGIDAVAVLFDIHRKALKPLGGKGFLSLDSFFPIGMKLFQDLEELMIEGVSIEALKHVDRMVQDGIPQGSFERLQSVSWFYDRFYRQIRERSFSTRSLRYCAAAEFFDLEDLSGVSEIVIAGFFAFTSAEKKLFERLSDCPCATAFFQDGPGMEDMLSSLGVETEIIDGAGRAPVVSLYKSPDVHGQTFALKRVLSGVADVRTVIVLPSADTLFPVLHHAIPELPEDSFNISMGYPLSRTPLFGFFNSLAQVMITMEGDRVYLPDYLTFVLHPYVKNILFHGRADSTRIIFHTLEDVMTEKRTQAFRSLNEIEQDRSMLTEVSRKLEPVHPGITAEQVHDHLRRIHDSLIRRFFSLRSISDFAQKASAVLAYIYDESTARLHPYFHPFAETFISCMDAVSSSLTKDLAFDETASYFHFIRKYLGTCHVPFPGTPLKGLQVLGLLETRNLSFDRVFILDMNEDIIPATVRDESLLPFKVRKALNLPTYLDRDRMTAYHIETLIRSSREAHLFYVENSRKEKSRFVEKLLWDMQKKDSEIRPDNYVQAVFYDVKLDSRIPAGIEKTAGIVDLLREFEYSASSLDAYLACQLRFYYRYVLGISERAGITGEIEKADIGRFVHDLLHDFFAGTKGRLLQAEDLSENRMQAMIDRQFVREYGRVLTGSLYLLKMQITRHLREFLKGYQATVLADGPVEIQELETDIRVTWNSFVLKGRLDRVEKRGDRLYIIDYKTQAHDKYLRVQHDILDPDLREGWTEAIGSLQLPLYLLLLSESRGLPAEKVTPLFLLLGRVRLDRQIEVPLFDESDDVLQRFDALKSVIVGLLREITNPAVPFKPAHDTKASCPVCAFRYLCGTQWITARR